MVQQTQQKVQLPKGLYYEMLATSGNETTVHSTCYTLSQAVFSQALRVAFQNPKVTEIVTNVNDYSSNVQWVVVFDLKQGMAYRQVNRMSQEDYEAYQLQLPSLLG